MKRELDKFHLMQVFKFVVDEGSFTKAALRLKMKTSSASKAVAQLEDFLGTRLLHRTTRSISLTDTGKRYYARAQDVLQQLEELEMEILSQRDEPVGNLRVAAPLGLGQFHLGPLIPQFIEQYPKVSVELDLSDRLVDVSREGFDVAVRTVREIKDSTLYSLSLNVLTFQLVASPDYLETHGAPKKPEDLKEHNALLHTSRRNDSEWEFFKEGESTKVVVSGNFKSNSLYLRLDAARQGLGIANLSPNMTADDVEAGNLVCVLPDYEQEPIGRYAIYQHKRELSPKLDVFLSFLSQHF